MMKYNKQLKCGFDLDDTIFDFSGGYLKRFKRFPKYDWALWQNTGAADHRKHSG